MSGAAKKIVVCGGNGFVGSRICKYAVARGWNVTSIRYVGKSLYFIRQADIKIQNIIKLYANSIQAALGPQTGLLCLRHQTLHPGATMFRGRELICSTHPPT